MTVLPGGREPDPVDLDATVVLAYSEEKAAPTWKKTFGFHPLAASADHGAGAGGEPLAILLRPGNAGSNTASEHIEVTRLALAQLPRRARRRALIRTDSGGGTHHFVNWLAHPGRRLHYSVGMTITEDMQEAILTLPDRVWEPAYDVGGEVRPGAWVAELTGLLDLAGWPEGMRVIIRRECPHPRRPAALHRPQWPPVHRLRHRRPARPARRLRTTPPPPRRCEDRIRAAKDAGLRNLPLHGFAQNQLWCELVAMASELTAWMQMLAFDGPARAWEPKRLRLRLFSAAGRLVHGGRRLWLRLATTWPWAPQLAAAITRLQAYAPADQPEPTPTTRKGNQRARGTPPTRRDS